MTPKKYPQNVHTPKNIHFSETPKNIEIQKFDPKKNGPSLRMYENIRVPPLGFKYFESTTIKTTLYVPYGLPK